MHSYDQIATAAQRVGLVILGGFHPDASDDLDPSVGTILMLGPDEPQFWDTFATSPERQDGQPNPMDRWSDRTVRTLASQLAAKPFFPFTGPPFMPFFSWALRTGRMHASPVNLLVHDTAGLLVSFRGALAFTQHIPLPLAPPCPCDSCDGRPCLAACPVSAITPGKYDVDKCKDFLNGPSGAGCMDGGCAVRVTCPVSQSLSRHPGQAAFHMKAFNPQ